MGNRSNRNNLNLPTMGEDATGEIFGSPMSRASMTHLQEYVFSDNEDVNNMVHYLTNQFKQRYRTTVDGDYLTRMAHMSLPIDAEYKPRNEPRRHGGSGRKELDDTIEEAINIMIDEGIIDSMGNGSYRLNPNIVYGTHLPDDYYLDEIYETISNL